MQFGGRLPWEPITRGNNILYNTRQVLDLNMSNAFKKALCLFSFVGGVIHFTVSTIICLFCFSIFNVLVAILTFSTDSWFKRHPMATFVIELIFASIISGSLVGGAHAGCSYATEPFLVYWCAPQGHDNIFYTFMLPLQIVIIVGMIMMFFIIRRLRQVSRNIPTPIRMYSCFVLNFTFHVFRSRGKEVHGLVF